MIRLCYCRNCQSYKECLLTRRTRSWSVAKKCQEWRKQDYETISINEAIGRISSLVGKMENVDIIFLFKDSASSYKHIAVNSENVYDIALDIMQVENDIIKVYYSKKKTNHTMIMPVKNL